MSRFVEVIRNAADRPVEAIQTIIAVVLFCFGLYLISPWYVPVSGTSIANAFAGNEVQRVVISMVCYVFPSIPILLGLFIKSFQTNKWYAFATNYMFVGLLFLTLLRLLTVGFVPFLWIFSLGLCLCSGVCSLYWRRNA